MRIDCDDLPQHLAKSLRPLYTVYGAESLLALEAQDRIRAAARKAGYLERELLTVDTGFEWSSLKFTLSSQSLFAARKIVELRAAGGKIGNQGAAAFAECFANPSPETLILIVLHPLERSAQHSGWFEQLDRAGVMVAANEVTRERLPGWINARLKAQGQTATAETLRFLADQVEGNLHAAFQEIQKLALLFEAGPLELYAVQQAVLDVARFDIFKLSEAMLGADAKRLVRILQGLRDEGVKPPLVLWAISEEIRAFAKIQSGLARGGKLPQLLKDNRVWGTRQGLIERALRRNASLDAEALLREAARCDRIGKGLEPGDAWDELQQLGLAFAGHAAVA
jgi:DNA polymerase III subunit delta